jgi:uncharacterized low-complexity protein
MQKKFQKSPLASVLGTAIVTSLTTTAVGAAQDPFAVKALDSGYLVVAEEGKGKAEMSCGEGKCGAQMMKSPEMKCGAGMQEMMKQQEAQQKKATEGKCAGMAPEPTSPETKMN